MEAYTSAKFAELVVSIRAGDQQAVTTLRDLLKPGVTLLISGRVTSQAVDLETEVMLNRIISLIEREVSIADSLPACICSLINGQFPHRNSLYRGGVPSDAGLLQAKKLLRSMSVVEQEVLKRRYVLAESSHVTAAVLSVSQSEYDSIVLRARALFVRHRPVRSFP